MWTTLQKRCPHAHSPNKCKCQPRNNIDQEAALASPHSAHHSQAPRQPAHRFPRGGTKGFRSYFSSPFSGFILAQEKVHDNAPGPCKRIDAKQQSDTTFAKSAED